MFHLSNHTNYMPYGSLRPGNRICSSKYPALSALYVFIATGIPEITCCARTLGNRKISRQFPSLCKHLKITFYLAIINELFSKIIVNTGFRFHSEMPRLNSLKFSGYLTMDFEDILFQNLKVRFGYFACTLF